MSGYVVDLGGVRAAENFVAELTEELHDRLQRVDAVAEDVFASGWSGVAATAYERAWDEWRAAARTVLAALGAMSEALARTAADYGTSEHCTVSGFERLAS